METNQVNLGASLKNLETQMGQLSLSLKENPSRFFPSETKKNLKECIAVTLRSGKELDEPKKIKNARDQVEKSKIEAEKEKGKAENDQERVENNNKEKKQKHDEVVSRRITFLDNPPTYTPPLPFPERFRKTKLDDQFAKFLNIFKNLEVNIPFFDALAQMPNCIKIIKEIMSNRKKLDAYGTVSLSENCSAIIHRKLLEKLKDPGSFTIPCVIREHTFSKTICDPRASINLMPFLVAKKLNLKKITPTSLSLQMDDRSMTFPKGIIEDVLIKVDKFIFPMDLVVLDMEENKEAPIILGRSFLVTNQALIDVKHGKLTLIVGEDLVKFNLYKSMEFPNYVNASGLTP